MNRIEAQLAWAEIEQQGRNAEAARPMVQGAINHRYSLDIARENIDDYELVIAPEAPGLAHLMDINKIIGADPRQMRLIGFNVVLDYQVSDWEIRKRAPNPHPESEAMPTIAGLKGLDDGRLAVIIDPATYNTEAGSITLWTEEEKDHALRTARLEALEEAAKIVESLADANIMNGPCEKVYAEAIRELGKK